MLRAPFIRTAGVGRKCCAQPLEYNVGGGRRGAVFLLSSLRQLDDSDGISFSSAPPSLATWLYRSCLLRRLWMEGVVSDAIVAGGLTASEFTGLLHSVFRTPRFVQNENAVSQGDALRLIREVQKDFLLRVMSALVEDLQWPWTPQECWECATKLVRHSVCPDDVINILLLLPLARRVAEVEGKGFELREILLKFYARKLHGGILWLLARSAILVSLQHETWLLEAVTVAACSASTSSLLATHRDDVDDGDKEKRLLTYFMQKVQQAGHLRCVAEQGSGFSNFWGLVFYEMVCYAHYVLDDLAANDHVRVGAILSLRRILCSFRRHNCVRPVLELHSALTAPWRKDPKYDPTTPNTRYGPLVYREALLFDAYTLMTLGHVGETAVDMNDTVLKDTLAIQSRCVTHLDTLLQSEPVAEVDRDALGLHRGARAKIRKWLREGIRLSFKVLLRCGAHEEICQLLTRCPELGGSWEAGKALMMLQKYTEAVSVFADFLKITRQKFASGLPHYIRSMMLEAVVNAARSCLENIGDAHGKVFCLYELTRTWVFPVPSAVPFAAIVRGLCSFGHTKECTAKYQKLSLEIVGELFQHHLSVAACPKVGLLLETIVAYVKLVAECDDDDTLKKHLGLLLSLQQAHHRLPVSRVALLHFLRVGCKGGVTAMLRNIVPQKTNVTIFLKPLQELPFAALELLFRHVTEIGNEEPHVLSAILSALEYRRFVEEQRLPWQCHLCRQWNKKNANICRLCGSLDIAVVCCHACGGFSPTNSFACLICGSELRQRTCGHEESFLKDNFTVYPLRTWRCSNCNYTNDPQHFFYCSKCGYVQPTIEANLTQTAFDCITCGRHNSFGLLRPWCSACGTLSTVATKGPPKTLWQCVGCGTLSPWLLTHCHGCGGTKPVPESRIDISWFTKICKRCNKTSPAWSAICHACDKEFVDQQEEKLLLGEDAGGVKMVLGPVHSRCLHCGSAYTEEDGMVCHSCFACRPNATCLLWVCLRGNCLGVNLQHAATSDDLLVCGHCGVPHKVAAVGGYQSSPLRYRESIRLVGEGGSGASSTVACANDGDVGSVPTALQLPVPSTPRRCFSCGAFLQLQNVAYICPVCHHCGYPPSQAAGCFSVTEHDVAVRLTLRAMRQTARRVKLGETPRPAALALLRSMTTVLLRAEEAQLPWRGCDLSNGMRCGVGARVPVMKDATVHGAVRDVAEIIRAICAVVSSATAAEEAKVTAVGVAAVATATTLWMQKRPWVRVALDLVDLMNRTTDYDELGFDVLAELCMVVRPQQGAHVMRETRWAYLRHMKLPIEWILNGVVCPRCLLAKTRNAETAEHTCCCPSGVDGDTDGMEKRVNIR